MPATDQTRLTISWSKQTDLDLRSYLGSHGMKKGDLSKFIEEAVQRQLFERTVEDIKDRNTDAEAFMELIDETVRDVRRARAARRKAAA